MQTSKLKSAKAEKEKKIKKGNFAVIKKNGKVIFSKKADKKGLLIEGDLSKFDVVEKLEKDLTKEEKEKQKQFRLLGEYETKTIMKPIKNKLTKADRKKAKLAKKKFKKSFWKFWKWLK